MQTIALIIVTINIFMYTLYLFFLHEKKSVLIRSDMLLILNIVSFVIFICYMYESPEFGNDKDNEIAAKLGLSISNRNMGRIIITIMTFFYLYTSIDLTHRVKKIEI